MRCCLEARQRLRGGSVTPVFSLVGMFSVSIAGYLDSTVLHSIHARLLGISLGPIDTIFTGTGILAILGGLYAMVSLRSVTLAKEGDTPPSSTVDG